MTFQNIFRDREYNKKLLRLTFPIALQNLLGAMVAAADALMLGKVNQQVMAAVSLPSMSIARTFPGSRHSPEIWCSIPMTVTQVSWQDGMMPGIFKSSIVPAA